MFGFNNGEDDVMIDIGEFFNEIESGESQNYFKIFVIIFNQVLFL